MNQQQVKYLKERIREVLYKKRQAASRTVAMPADVAKAKRILGKWEKERQQIVQKRYDALNEAHSKAFEAIMLRDPSDALKALREFERF